MPSHGAPPSRRADLRVTSVEHPGWRVGEGTLPRVGERVLSLEGEADVVRVLGRITDGGRLLELRLATGSKTPYFAASSNVLRRSEEDQVGGPAGHVLGDP